MGKKERTRGGGLDLIMYGDNEDAIGINSQCSWMCMFVFGVICTELSSGVLMARLRD